MSEENPNALKHMFDVKLLEKMAKEIAMSYPQFNKSQFMDIKKPLLDLEMKARVHLIRDQLKTTLPQDYPSALKILLKTTQSGKLNGFNLWPYTEFIQKFGMDHVKISLEALKEVTTLFTSEWAVRPFIKKDLEQTLSFLLKCSTSKDVHIRRWVSEGTRPRLPWGERLHDFIKEPTHTLKLLEYLKFDPELYVRKSVANHLNDISKDHPKLVVKVLKTWKSQATTEEEEKRVDWIIKHALRSLIKNGDEGALKLIGVSSNAPVKLSKFKIKNKNIVVGEKLEFEFEVSSQSKKTETFVIDYALSFKKANGTNSAKVFKLKNIKLKSFEKQRITKTHSIKVITTRKYYLGKQHLIILVNGKPLQTSDWILA